MDKSKKGLLLSISLKHHRLKELDALRGIAALGVVLFHYTSWFNNKFTLNIHPPFLFWLGYCGVHLFFMISGFVIFMTLEKTKKPLDFVVSRFSRLYPAYWAVLLINLMLVNPIDPKQFLLNSTMITAWLNTKNIVPAFWTLNVELAFYIFMFTLFVTKTLKHIEAMGVLWLILMILNERLGTLFHIHIPWLIDKSLLLTYGNLFFAGILFYKIKFEGNSVQRNMCLVLCWLTQFLVAREYYPSPEMLALFFFIFYLFCYEKLGFLTNKFFLFFGSISYSLYLIHQNLGIKLLLFFDAQKTNFYLSLFIAMGSSILLAFLITILIEQPALKFIRTNYNRK